MAKDKTILPPINVDEIENELRQLLKDAERAHEKFNDTTAKQIKELEVGIDAEAAAMAKTERKIADIITDGLEEITRAQAKIHIPELK